MLRPLKDGKDGLQQMVLEKLETYMQKNNVGTLLYII
jgi:hypothetical protein